LLLLSACITFISFCSTTSIPPLLPVIEKDLGITTAVATQLLSLPMLAAALSLIFAGAFADRYGILPSLFVALLFGAVPSALMPLIGTNFVTVLILRSLGGLLAGFSFCVMSSIIAIWFPINEKGLAAGIMGACVSLGGLGVTAAPYIHAATQSWQLSVAWLSLPGWIGIVVTLIAWARQPEPPVKIEPELVDKAAFKHALASPVTWVGVLMTVCAAWVMQSLYNIAPPYFSYADPKGIGLGPITAGNLMFGATVAGFIGPIFAGMLQDKTFKGNPKPVMISGFALCAVFVYLMIVPVVYTNMIFLAICVILAGIGTQLTYTLISVYVARTYPVTVVAKIIGLWMGVGMFGAVVGVSFGGYAIERFGRYSPLIFISLASVAGLILAASLKKLKGPEIKAAD